MQDLISRQAAIDALEKVAELFPWRVPGKSDTYDSYNEAWNDAIGRSEMEIEKLPPAQPEERTEERTETHACDYACDCISRQDAIRWVKTECNPYGKPTLDFESGKRVMEHLKTMPSVQPDIIYCKDCKHWREGTAFSYCDKLHGMGVLDALDYMTAEDDYCSMAERRTDEND